MTLLKKKQKNPTFKKFSFLISSSFLSANPRLHVLFMWLCARWSPSLYGRQIEDKDEMSSALTHRTFIHTLDRKRYKSHLFLIENTWVKWVCINEEMFFFFLMPYFGLQLQEWKHTHKVSCLQVSCVSCHIGGHAVSNTDVRGAWIQTTERPSCFYSWLI